MHLAMEQYTQQTTARKHYNNNTATEEDKKVDYSTSSVQ